MIPAFASGTLDGKPALLQYIPGRHALHGDVALKVCGDYPETGDLEIEVDVEKAMRFPLILRVPEWAEGFEATVDGQTYTPLGDRLLEIERTWSPGDTVRVRIPLHIRIVPDGDTTTESVAFVRGPQVLATDSAIDASGGIPKSEWWGDALYTCKCNQDGVEKEFRLVSFADAGQNKEDYAVLHEKIEGSPAVPGSH